MSIVQKSSFFCLCVLAVVIFSAINMKANLIVKQNIATNSLVRVVGEALANQCHLRAKRPDCDPHQQDCFNPVDFPNACGAGQQHPAFCVGAVCKGPSNERQCDLADLPRNYNVCEKTGKTINIACGTGEVRCELRRIISWNQQGAGFDVVRVHKSNSDRCPDDTIQAECD